MLSQWAHSEGKGVLVDLRNDHSAGSTRTNYLVQSPDFSIPVVLLWNTSSNSRVKAAISMLQSMPAVKCIQTGESSLGANDSRHDCFAGY
jgi:hypothetical protein